VNILAVESSTTVCSVAVINDEGLITVHEVNDGYQHAKILTSLIEQVFKETGVHGKNLSAVAVSKGPGSYTGLRIGVSAAKGICFATGVPLIGVSALEAMAYSMASFCQEKVLLVPMIDAGRMEVYMAVFDSNMNRIYPVESAIIHHDSFLPFENEYDKIILMGNGAQKFKAMFIGNPQIEIREDILPSAQHLLPLAINSLKMNHTEDLAYFEPFYLKNFIAGKPRVKGLF
jgi:tRNA threonylcarbamoyladenosine biosynthesis protein TsaB